MLKNTAGQKVGSQLVAAADGSAFTGFVTVEVTVDAGTQATGSVGSGACTHEGNGYHTYAPAQAETNGDLVAFTFHGTGAVPSTVQIYTKAGDAFTRLGAPVGASISADVAGVQSDTNDIQSRLPAALQDGYIMADVEEWKTHAVPAAATDGVPAVDVYSWQTHVVPSNPVDGVPQVDVAYNLGHPATVDGNNLPSVNTKDWNDTAVAVPSVAGFPLVDTDFGRQGTLQGATAGTITLDSGASANDGTYDGQICYIKSGTGLRQSRLILSYVGATKVATLNRNWVTTPNSASKYQLIPGEMNLSAWLRVVPNALISGRVDAYLGDIATGVVTSIFAFVYEGTETFKDFIRLSRAILMGVSSGHPTTPAFKDLANTKTRVTATVDSSGNRSSPSTDPT